MSSKEEINNWLQGDRKAETSAPRAVIRVIKLHDFCSCMVVFIFSLGEGSGSPLQSSRLENPRDGGAWWAAVYGVAELDTTERLHFHFSLSCIREGNGNPLQCSCLENPRDRGAWWAACRLWGLTESDTTEVTQQQQQYSLSMGPTLSSPDLCPQVCGLPLCLCLCPANRFISSIFLDSVCMC